MYECKTCGKSKSLDRFGAANTKLGHKKQCKDCFSAYMKKYYKKHPGQYEKQKRYVSKNDKNYKFSWYRHNISKEKYEQMYDKYQGKCWACKINPVASIDHDHKCCAGHHSCGDCIRGLLCRRCNTTLGHLQDSTELLNNLIDYLSHTSK